MQVKSLNNINYDPSQGEKLVDLGDGLIVGKVLRQRVHTRRNNFRAMNPQQLAGLREAVDAIGFKSLITLNAEEDDTFSIIDGHHRIDEIDRRNMPLVPAVFVRLDKQHADLSMIRFNLSAETKALEFNDLLKEIMADGVDTSILSNAAGVSEDYLQMLMDSANNAMDLDTGVNPEEVLASPQRKPKGKRKYVVLFDVEKRRLVGGVHSMPASYVVSRALQGMADLVGLGIFEAPMVEAETEADLEAAVSSYTGVDD